MWQRVALGRGRLVSVAVRGGLGGAEEDGLDGVLDLADVVFLEEDGEVLADDELQGRLALGGGGLGLHVAARREERRDVSVVEGVAGPLCPPVGEELLDLVAGQQLDGVGGALDDLQVAVDVDEVAAGLDAVDDVDGLALTLQGHLAGLPGRGGHGLECCR